jgi:glycosyltransferase involved in cell wall biosynthesis
MKVVHTPFTYHPGPVGGTEVYVESLARCLQQRQVTSIIAAPGKETAFYEHAGLAVRRFALSDEVNDIRDLYGEGDVKASQEFAKILDDERPDILHMHAFTRGVSLLMAREARRRGVKVVFTYHTPTVSCQRGTLMRWGQDVCDGKLNVHDCSACSLQALGLSKMTALALGRAPSVIRRLAGAAKLSGGVWTAMRMTELVQLRHSAFQALMREVDQVVALCGWVKELLFRNGVPNEKVVVSRHGLQQSMDAMDAQFVHVTTDPLRIAFLGRLDRTKGADTLIQALRSLPEARIELSLYGIPQGGSGAEYLDELKKLAGNDPRIRFLTAVPSNQIISLLRSYHLLAVPSRWLETGPLVVLEAFAAGIPVIGSNLGGIAELIENEVNGILVETDSVEMWKQAMRRFMEDKTLIERLRGGIRAPKGMDAVAGEMLRVYSALVADRGGAKCCASA